LKYGCESSDHQKPVGHPVVVETAGFEITIATRFLRFAFTGLESFRLMDSPEMKETGFLSEYSFEVARMF
jgi:hypothetical protein